MHSNSLFLSAVKSICSGNLDSAEYFLLALSENDPDAKSYAFLGWLYGSQGRERDAVRCYFKAVRQDPDSGFPYNDFGVYLIGTGRSEASVKWFLKALHCRKFEQKHISLYNLALLYQIWNRPERSARFLNLALVYSPDFTEAVELLDRIADLKK